MEQRGHNAGRLTGLRGHRVLNPAKQTARRSQILLATAAVLAAKAYDEATLDDVARHMGCSKAVIYYQFRGKEDVVVALIETVVENAIARLRAIAATDEPPELQLEHALVDLVRAGWQPMDHAAIRIGRPTSLSLESQEHLRELDRQYEAVFSDIVSRGMESGALRPRDTRLVTFTLINAVHSIFRWARRDGPLGPETFVREVPAMLLHGVLSRTA